MSNKKIIITISVLSFVIVFALAYATLTGQLNILGTANTKKANWKVYFSDISNISHSSTASVNPEPSISQDSPTTINNYAATFVTSGDYISFEVTVKNDGDYDVKLSDFTIGTPTCTVTGVDPDNSAGKVCSKLNYTIRYKNGAQLIKNSDVLQAHQSTTIVVNLIYLDISSKGELPINITNLGINFVYNKK